MGRVLRDTRLDSAPIAVPAPGSWDPVAQAAYEQGRVDGYSHGLALGDREGYERGRRDLDAVADRTVQAAHRCFDEVRRLHTQLVARTIELADLYVRTVIRTAPDASAHGMLARIEEALTQLEPGELELAVEPSVLEELTALFAAADHAMPIRVTAGDGLTAGEYRIRTDWAEADGTWDRYIEAAREAMTMYVVEHPG
jgi:flagellar biosynthesis/type III secretory pathway protein FliH